MRVCGLHVETGEREQSAFVPVRFIIRPVEENLPAPSCAVIRRQIGYAIDDVVGVCRYDGQHGPVQDVCAPGNLWRLQSAWELNGRKGIEAGSGDKEDDDCQTSDKEIFPEKPAFHGGTITGIALSAQVCNLPSNFRLV